jgi:hypothetical protein
LGLLRRLETSGYSAMIFKYPGLISTILKCSTAGLWAITEARSAG